MYISAAALGLVLALVVALALVVLVLEILLLLNLQRTLERVSPKNRAMTPGLVWLQFIPLFGSFWTFYIVIKVRDSVRAEYQARGWAVDSDFGLNIGIAAGVLTVVGSGGLSLLPGRMIAVSLVVSLGAMICWIIYWVRTAGFKKRLGPPSWAAFGPLSAGGPFQSSLDNAGPDDVEPADDAEPARNTLLCPVCTAGVRAPDRFCNVCGSRLPWSDE